MKLLIERKYMKLQEKDVKDLLTTINSSGLAICRDYYVYFGPTYNRTYPFESNKLRDRLVYVDYLSDEDYSNYHEIQKNKINQICGEFPFVNKTLVRDAMGYIRGDVTFEVYVDGIRFVVDCKVQDYGLRHMVGYNLENFSIESIERSWSYTDDWEIKE